MKFKFPIRILQKYLAGNASNDEKEKVEQWYESFEEEQNLLSKEELSVAKTNLYNRITNELDLRKPVMPLYKKFVFRAAAAVLILLAGGYYFISYQKNERQSITDLSNRQFKNDVAPPTGNKATLTLADGTKIDIDSSANGIVAMQGNINIEKQQNGIIKYNGEAKGKISYNTLTVPKGSKPMRLLLVDGTEVWLNVASSIIYPTAFAGSERKVEITGEAYFEVAKNKEMPFVVKKSGSDEEVKVLGTHFNFKTYDDEATKITLLEGAVAVSSSKGNGVLLPGQQAFIHENSMTVLNNVDMEEVTAWKNGRFYFDGADIKTIMKQVEKWYNADIVYESEIPYSFVAKISRNVNASELLKILQLTELVHFRIDGNKITVMK